MKKILSILGFLMFASFLASPMVNSTVFGATANNPEGKDTAKTSAPFSTARIFSRIPLSKFNGNDWSDVFGTDDVEKAGQNMYLKIYDMTINQPEQKALKNITGKYGTTEGEMTQILYGNYGPIIQRTPSLRQEEIVNKMAEIQQEFAEEKEVLQFKAKLEAAVQPNEFFVNGSITDSGFDLINDLDLIQKILFLKTDPIDVGGSFNPDLLNANQNKDGSNNGASGQDAGQNSNNGQGGAQQQGGSQDKDGLQGDTQQNSSPGSQGNQNSGNGNQAINQGGGSTNQGNAGQNTGSSPGANKVALGGSTNPNLCFGSNDITQSLQKFEDNKVKDKNYQDGSNNSQNGGQGSANGSNQKNGNGDLTSSGNGQGGNKDGSSNNGSNQGNNGSGVGPQTPKNSPTEASTPAATPAAQPAPADNWLSELPCNDVLCVTVKLMKKKGTTFQDSDNCIACHIEKINEKLKYTIDHSLTPSKATGNLGEPATCKKASANALQAIGLNFYAIAQPVTTPKNDDLIYGITLKEEWKSFVNAYKPFPIYELEPPKADDPKADTTPPSERDKTLRAAVSAAGPNTTFEETQKSYDAEIKGNAEKRAKVIKLAEISLQSDIDVGFYQAIRREVQQMNYYFGLYKNIINSLHSKVPSLPGKQACVELKEKKQCEQ